MSPSDGSRLTRSHEPMHPSKGPSPPLSPLPASSPSSLEHWPAPIKAQQSQEDPTPGQLLSTTFYNTSARDEKVLRDNSKRLFAVESEKEKEEGKEKSMSLEVCTLSAIGCKAEILRSEKQLVDYLNEEESSSIIGAGSIPTSRIFFISQPTSRAKFSFSESAFKTLSTRLKVFSSFTNVLSCFGLEDGPHQDGRGCFYETSRRDATGALRFETAYILKHVEHKAGSNIPFSIRQMAVYQGFECVTSTSSNILVQTSRNVQAHIFSAVQEGSMAVFPDHWKNVHEIHLSSLSDNWIDYVKFLQLKISDIEDAVRYARRDTPDRVTFVTLQQLSKYSDILIRLSHTLRMNIFVLEKLLETSRKRMKLDNERGIEEYESFEESIQTCITEHEFLKHHVTLVQNSSQELGALVRNTITLTDGDVMLTLTQKTIQEARTMRTITFIALIYLPASFTSTFLSMGYIHVNSLEGGMRLSVSNDMLFYLVITLPLMLATLSGWWLWEKNLKRKRQAAIEQDDVERLKNR